MSVTTDDLFAGFDAGMVEAIKNNYQAELDGQKRARAASAQSKIETRTAASDEILLDLLPERFERGTSWHVLTGGDVDALSFLRALVLKCGYFEEVTIATWRFSMPAMQQLHFWLDTGQIDKLHIIVDQRFPRLSLDVLTYAKSFIGDYGGTITVTKNHAKLTLAKNSAANDYLVVESSANYNINRRLEQTTIFNDKTLFDFYSENMRHVAAKSFAV